MATAWCEIETVRKENRRELCLRGPEVKKRVESKGLDPELYKLVGLNFLEIADTPLTSLSMDLGQLVNLTSLLLPNNRLLTLPPTIGKLVKLKTLNLSNNQISEVPIQLAQLPELETLNLSINQLTEFPSVKDLARLHFLDLSRNRLESLPENVSDASLSHLSQIRASQNEITEIPGDFSQLPHLNVLDLSENPFTEVPVDLSLCFKLKELTLKGNKVKDRRLKKMIDQCSTKSVLEYLNGVLEKEKKDAGGGAGKGKGKKERKKKGKQKEEDEEVEDLRNMLQVMRFSEDENRVVKVQPAVLDVRPYIACCIFRQINFKQSLNMFKHFITLQTRLHDTVCQKRQLATIATHDLKSVRMPLLYDARPPAIIKLTPLFKQKDISAAALMKSLRQEAEEVRKEKKRNTYSGIHKYLDLLKDKPLYPCLVDNEDVVISFPPITNSEVTKISADTTDMLIEVTSSSSLDICKKVLDSLLTESLNMGIGGAAGEGETTETRLQLIVEQVKMTDQEGSLKVVYPSRADLDLEGVHIVRN